MNNVPHDSLSFCLLKRSEAILWMNQWPDRLTRACFYTKVCLVNWQMRQPLEIQSCVTNGAVGVPSRPCCEVWWICGCVWASLCSVSWNSTSCAAKLRPSLGSPQHRHLSSWWFKTAFQEVLAEVNCTSETMLFMLVCTWHGGSVRPKS